MGEENRSNTSSLLTNHYHLGGALRVRQPEETLEVIQPYIEKASITRIANITRLDSLGIPVYCCFRPNSKSLSLSQGKGINDDLAKCSAYMEAIEHYYAESITPDSMIESSKLDASKMIFLEAFSSGMFRYTHVDNISCDWISTNNLIDGKNYFIPYDLLSLDLCSSNIGLGVYPKSSTGLASGNNNEEALCHALYEVVERNSFKTYKAISNQAKTELLINVDSIDNTHAMRIIELCKINKIDVLIFDITSQFLIPAFQCIFIDKSPVHPLGHFSGTGAHLDKGIALCRALTEAAQSRLTYIAGCRDDIFPSSYKLQWPTLQVSSERDYKEISSTTQISFADQLKFLINKFNEQQFDKVLVYYHTQPEDLISVVRVTIPYLTI